MGLVRHHDVLDRPGRALLAAALVGLAALPGPAARADAPSPRQVQALADELGVGPQAARLRSRLLPGARLLSRGSARLGGTRAGGRPDLPDGTAWPRCHGRPLTFLLQVSLGELRRAVPGATAGRGTLSVFVDTAADAEGTSDLFDLDGPLRRGDCAAVVHTPPGRGLVRRAFPRSVRRFPAAPQQLRPVLTLPGYGLASDLVPDELPEAWYDLVGRLANGVLDRAGSGDVPVRQLLGWARPLQEDPTTSCGRTRFAPGARRLLVQFDSSDRWDTTQTAGGTFAITLSAADLRAGRFDRLCGTLQLD